MRESRLEGAPGDSKIITKPRRFKFVFFFFNVWLKTRVAFVVIYKPKHKTFIHLLNTLRPVIYNLINLEQILSKLL